MAAAGLSIGTGGSMIQGGVAVARLTALTFSIGGGSMTQPGVAVGCCATLAFSMGGGSMTQPGEVVPVGAGFSAVTGEELVALATARGTARFSSQGCHENSHCEK